MLDSAIPRWRKEFLCSCPATVTVRFYINLYLPKIIHELCFILAVKDERMKMLIFIKNKWRNELFINGIRAITSPFENKNEKYLVQTNSSVLI